MEYIEWIKENWNTSGGLISQAHAAKILGKTRVRIKQMINEGKLTPYQYNKDAVLVSFSEVIKTLNKKMMLK